MMDFERQLRSEIVSCKNLNKYWKKQCEKLRKKVKLLEEENEKLRLLNMAFQKMWTEELPNLIKESIENNLNNNV